MAAASTTKGVNFGLLDDVEEGDELQLHFTPDFDGVIFVLAMIQRGDITSADETVLMAVQMSRDWGMPRNRYVNFKATAKFDRKDFEGVLTGRIDQLQVVNRRRPLVDVTVLDQTEKPVHFRFDADNPDSAKGWGDLVELHELGCLEILGETPEHERDISQNSTGSFTAKFAGQDAAYKQYFLDGVQPYLKFLRD